jgi:hypothetical protein
MLKINLEKRKLFSASYIEEFFMSTTAFLLQYASANYQKEYDRGNIFDF